MASDLDDYLRAAAWQMAARGRLLLDKIPRRLPLEYQGLVATTRDRLNGTIVWFTDFAGGSAARYPAPVRQRLFRRHVDDLDLIENIALTALHRVVDDDLRLTSLIGTICREISYPLLPPVVAALSTQYFAIDPFFHVMHVPLTEGHFLLHLPDLYHELAHPLLADKHDPKLDPFRSRFRRVVDLSSQHFADDIAAIRRGRTPQDLAALSAGAEFCWAQSWTTEFFCDVFAVATVGPAFGWAHLHLHSKRGRSAYRVPRLGPISHPADAARMSVVASVLRKLGFAADAADVEKRWSELVGRTEPDCPPEYHRCYPDALLENCVDEALAATRDTGCILAAPGSSALVRDALNDAWREMWRAPARYLEWERQAVERLHRDARNLC
jgi:hypothetical protein